MIEIHNFGDFEMIEIFNIEYFMLLIDIIHFCKAKRLLFNRTTNATFCSLINTSKNNQIPN